MNVNLNSEYAEDSLLVSETWESIKNNPAPFEFRFREIN